MSYVDVSDGARWMWWFAIIAAAPVWLLWRLAQRCGMAGP